MPNVGVEGAGCFVTLYGIALAIKRTLTRTNFHSYVVGYIHNSLTRVNQPIIKGDRPLSITTKAWASSYRTIDVAGRCYERIAHSLVQASLGSRIFGNIFICGGGDVPQGSGEVSSKPKKSDLTDT